MAPVSGTEYPAFVQGIPGEWLGIAVGAAFVLIAWLLPSRFRGSRQVAAPAE